MASHFGKEEPVPERKARDRHLGAPKLPTGADVPTPDLPADRYRLLGEQVVIPDVPPISTETLGVTQPEPGDTGLTPSDTGFVPEPAAVDERGVAGGAGRGRGRGKNPER